MNKFKEWKERIIRNRKLRCGAFSVLFSCLAVVLCVVICGVADTLEEKYALTRDYSFNAATVQGEVSQAVLDALEKDVHIYAVVPESGENATLMQLLERYDAASEKLTMSRENILRNPVLLEKFSDVVSDNKVSADCLIVHCAETGRTRVLDEDDYYVYSYDTATGTFSAAGLTYEKSITEAILYVSREELPAVQVLTGHGELTKADTAAMEQMLISANYEVKWVQLGEQQPDPQSPLLILSPYFDLSDEDLSLLMAFSEAGGDLLIACQYTDPLELPNFNALLRAYGIQSIPGLVIADETETDSYYASTPVWLMPYMHNTLATRTLVENAMDILLLPGARAFETVASDRANVNVVPVLTTGKAYIRNYADGLDTAVRQESDLYGTFDLALWADKMFDDGEVSHALVLGNVDVLTDEWLQSNTHASAFFLQMLRSLQGKTPVNLDIVPKNALRDGLELGNITTAVIITVLLPVAVLLAAAIVLLRGRRN